MLQRAAAAAAALGYWRHWPMLGWPASRLGMGNEPLGNLAAKPCVLACIWCISSCSICSHTPLRERLLAGWHSHHSHLPSALRMRYSAEWRASAERAEEDSQAFRLYIPAILPSLPAWGGYAWAAMCE